MTTSPSVFFAHGSPMSALGGDDHAAALAQFGSRHTPKAILVVSAHWQVSMPLRVTAWDHMPLLYDFGGFPRELYEIEYPVPGSPILAAQIARVLESDSYKVRLDTGRGLDHGAWVPLRLAWPAAGIPALQLSMPFVTPQELYKIGKSLRPLRDDGILIAATGGIVHNLSRVKLDRKQAPADDWAAEFDRWVADRVAVRNLEDLFAYRDLAPHARAAVPTTEHFDPLFIALGASTSADTLETIYEGFQYANLSMRSFSFASARSCARDKNNSEHDAPIRQ